MIAEETLKNYPCMINNTNEQYHSGVGLSNSGISLLLDCPKKYWDKYINPDKPVKKPTDSMRFGTLFHTFLLEHHLFEKEYIIFPRVKRSTKIWDEYEAKAKAVKKEIVFKDELQDLEKMRDAVLEHKFARKLITPNGKREQSIYWYDKHTNVLCKSRPDYLTDKFIVDVKTTACASPKKFMGSISDYGYHRQAAIALDGYEALTGNKHANFINLCIEPVRPYIVSVFIMDDNWLQLGQEEYKFGLEIYKRCIETNYWPPYVEEIEEITVPTWYRTKN